MLYAFSTKVKKRNESAIHLQEIAEKRPGLSTSGVVFDEQLKAIAVDVDDFYILIFAQILAQLGDKVCGFNA